ncbi:MAG: 8-oxoguanine DNA glycosylase [Methanoregula sp.]|nr:8-oxoguanine DNA glycosylase [Methanoregula sp.]
MPVLTLPPDQPFSLDQTLGCGQVFRWDRDPDGTWWGVVGSHGIRIRQDNRKLTFEGASVQFIVEYFSLDVDLEPVISSIDCDPFIHAAIKKCQGLRLIRQPKWECLVSYTIATNSNIPTIRRRIAAVSEKFGQKIAFKGKTFYAFPDPGSISCEEQGALSCCKLGYREPYVFRTACAIPDRKIWEDSMSALPYEEARRELMGLPGIGPKVADCILLFAFQKYEAFPVDVWIRRIMQQHYLPGLGTGSPLTGRQYDTIRCFAREHFGEFCGYAQEYLYAAREG